LQLLLGFGLLGWAGLDVHFQLGGTFGLLAFAGLRLAAAMPATAFIDYGIDLAAHPHWSNTLTTNRTTVP